MRVWLAEFIGTFALVFVGVGAITAGMTPVAIALAFGFVVAVMISAVGPVSAAHFNPAVTVGFFVMRRVSAAEMLLYWSAQLGGATVAMLTLRAAYGVERLTSVGFGATHLAPELTLWAGVGLEAVLTFFLMFVIASLVLQKHKLDGLYIGLTVSTCVFAGGVLTGASMNPARSFGPALVSGVWHEQWVYWLGPVVGAVIATFAAQYLWRVQGDPLEKTPSLSSHARDF